MSEQERGETDSASIDAEVQQLVDDYRTRCLWFLKADYYPSTPEEILRVLRQVENNGDRAAFQRAGRLRQQLSRGSSPTSAGS